MLLRDDRDAESYRDPGHVEPERNADDSSGSKDKPIGLERANLPGDGDVHFLGKPWAADAAMFRGGIGAPLASAEAPHRRACLTGLYGQSRQIGEGRGKTRAHWKYLISCNNA